MLKKTKPFNNNKQTPRNLLLIFPSHRFFALPKYCTLAQNTVSYGPLPSRLAKPAPGQTPSQSHKTIYSITIHNRFMPPELQLWLPYLPLLFFFAIALVTIDMISVGELVKAGRSGIFSWLSHLTRARTRAHPAREWHPEFFFAQLLAQAAGRQKFMVGSLSSCSLSKNIISLS